jgi:hypothetical protein
MGAVSGAIGALLFASALSCATPAFRPAEPRRVEAGGERVELVRTDLRAQTVYLDLEGASPAVVEGAWIADLATKDGAACARRLAAKKIERGTSATEGKEVALKFDRALVDVLEHPTNLELRLSSNGAPAECVALPFSGTDERWIYEPWGNNPLFAGRDITFWFPLGSGRYSSGIDFILLRFGRWWGPVKLGVGAGFSFTCCDQNDKTEFVLPTEALIEGFPIQHGRLAVGLGASYEVRPTWASGGVELIHGPVGSVELAYAPRRFLGFIEGPKAGTFGLAVSLGRWLPNGGATVMMISLKHN